MGCACSDKKKLDFDYVRKLANAYSITNKIDIQIYYIIGYDGKTKYYDYEPANGGRKLQVVETIRFSEYKSGEVLPDNEQSGIDIIIEETIKPIKPKSARVYQRKVDSDSGTVL
jgi:alkyl hydroperoxide reductase subunit AhpC